MKSKRTLSDDGMPEDKKRVRFPDENKHAMLGINLLGAKFQEVINSNPDDDAEYVRRRRPGRTLPAEPTASLQPKKESLKQAVESEVSGLEKAYSEWVAQGLPDISSDEQICAFLTDGDYQALLKFEQRPEKKTIEAFVELSKKFKVELEERIDRNFRDNPALDESVQALTKAFMDRFVDSVLNETESTFKKNEEKLPKRENPLNVYQRDRRAVISQLEALVAKIDESVRETYKSMNQDFIRDIDGEIEQKIQKVRVVDYDEPLERLMDRASRNSLSEVDSSLEHVIREALANEKKMEHIFRQLMDLADELQTAEDRINAAVAGHYETVLKSNGVDLIESLLSSK